MSLKFKISNKQYQAIKLLHDDITNEIVFGGGARGGKSFLGAFWVLERASRAQPGSKWLIAREELKALKRTTLRTFFKVAKALRLESGKHYRYNAQDMVIEFWNGSTVFFAELKKIPSDPEFDRIGSYDLTGAWIDEAQEVSKDAKDALQFRFSVLAGHGWNTTPKTLYTCNPDKGWIYRDFWYPIVKNKQKIEGRAFITSLYTDNPWIDHEKYKKNVIKTKNKIKIQRLLHGNYEYDDNPYRLIADEAIVDMFGLEIQKGKDNYISCDVARFGQDKTVIVVWEGLISYVHVFEKLSTGQIADKIKNYMRAYNVPPSRVVIDEDGVGGGVVDNIEGCVGFVNNSSAIQPPIVQFEKDKKLNYANLKVQCYFKLADYINHRKIRVNIEEEAKDMLVEELEQVVETNVDKDKKITIATKEEIKQNIGRSPDLSDAIMMRMYFELSQDQFFNPIFV